MEALLPRSYRSVKNGYCLPRDADCMSQLSLLLSQQPDLASKLSEELGVHWDTQVGCDDMTRCPQRVCQVFCTALPVSYCHLTKRGKDWELFATLVLTAA